MHICLSQSQSCESCLRSPKLSGKKKKKRFCISTSFLESNCHLCYRYSGIKGHSSSPGVQFLQSSFPTCLLHQPSATASRYLLPEPEHLIYGKTHLAFPDTCLLSPSNCFVSLNLRSLLWPAEKPQVLPLRLLIQRGGQRAKPERGQPLELRVCFC